MPPIRHKQSRDLPIHQSRPRPSYVYRLRNRPAISVTSLFVTLPRNSFTGSTASSLLVPHPHLNSKTSTSPVLLDDPWPTCNLAPTPQSSQPELHPIWEAGGLTCGPSSTKVDRHHGHRLPDATGRLRRPCYAQLSLIPSSGRPIQDGHGHGKPPDVPALCTTTTALTAAAAVELAVQRRPSTRRTHPDVQFATDHPSSKSRLGVNSRGTTK